MKYGKYSEILWNFIGFYHMDIKVENRNRSFLQQLRHIISQWHYHILCKKHKPKEHERTHIGCTVSTPGSS